MDSSPLDTLTGAVARPAMLAHIRAMHQAAQDTNGNFSLALLDLDYLKSINDAFGHARGDQVLVELVRRIQATIRSRDEVIRYGGDEFLILLAGSGKAQAVAALERIRQALAAAPVDGTPPVIISASMGLATFPEDGQTPEVLFSVADRRLYVGKSFIRGSLVADDNLESQEGTLPRVPSRMMERDIPMQHVRDFLRQLGGTEHGVLIVDGPAGSGRTRFLNEALQIGRLQGFAVWQARGLAALRLRSYGALARMQQHSGWPHLFERPAAVAEALQQWVSKKKFCGVLIGLDDVAGIDPETLETITALLGMNLGFPLGLFYSGNPTPEVNLSAARFGADGLLTRLVTLEPLRVHGLRVWVRHSLRWEAPTEFLNWLHLQTGGMPARIARALSWLLAEGLLVQLDKGWSVSSFLTGEMYSAPGALMHAVDSSAPLPSRGFPPAASICIGRNTEIAQVENLLDQHGLVTICAPDGVGKTRLAWQVAQENLSLYPDGVTWIVPDHAQTLDVLLAEALGFHLTAITAPGVPATPGMRIGNRLPNGTWVTPMAEQLQKQRMLLVIDDLAEMVLTSSAQTAAPSAGREEHALETAHSPLLNVEPHFLTTATHAEASQGEVVSALFERSEMLPVPSYIPTRPMGFLEELLQAAPHVRVLITRPTPLQANKEQVFWLGNLTYPMEAASALLENLPMAQESAAVQLFLYHARQARPDFTPTEEDWPAILRICALVDGIPIGIEMAAVWVTHYTCAEIAEKIIQDTHVLTAPQRVLPTEAVFDSLWRLFSPLEQSTLAALSVFQNSFSGEAAYRVAGASPFFLDALAAKRIVREVAVKGNATEGISKPTSPGMDFVPKRYAMHLLVAQYAARLLGMLSFPLPEYTRATLSRVMDADQATNDHATAQVRALAMRAYVSYYFQILAQMADRFTNGADLPQNMAPDLPNFAAAWHTKVTELAQTYKAAEADAADGRNAILQMVQALEDAAEGFFSLTTHLGRFLDGMALANAAIEQLPPLPGAPWLRLRARLLTMQGEFCYHAGDYPSGIAFLDQALVEITDLPHEATPANLQLAQVLRLFATLYVAMGDYATATRYLERAAAIAEQLKQPRLLFILRNRAGVGAYFQEDMPRAARYFQAALETAQMMEDSDLMAVAMSNLGDVALLNGDYAQSRAMLTESLALSTPQMFATLRASIFCILGRLETATDHPQAAAQYFIEGLTMLQSLDAKPLVLELLLSVARLWNQHSPHLYQRALGLACLVAQHPASYHFLRRQALRFPGCDLETITPGWRVEHLRRASADVLEWLREDLEQAS